MSYNQINIDLLASTIKSSKLILPQYLKERKEELSCVLLDVVPDEISEIIQSYHVPWEYEEFQKLKETHLQLLKRLDWIIALPDRCLSIFPRCIAQQQRYEVNNYWSLLERKVFWGFNLALYKIKLSNSLGWSMNLVKDLSKDPKFHVAWFIEEFPFDRYDN